MHYIDQILRAGSGIVVFPFSISSNVFVTVFGGDDSSNVFVPIYRTCWSMMFKFCFGSMSALLCSS